MRGGRAALGLAAALAFALPAPGAAQGGRGGLASSSHLKGRCDGFPTVGACLTHLTDGEWYPMTRHDYSTFATAFGLSRWKAGGENWGGCDTLQHYAAQAFPAGIEMRHRFPASDSMPAMQFVWARFNDETTTSTGSRLPARTRRGMRSTRSRSGRTGRAATPWERNGSARCSGSSRTN